MNKIILGAAGLVLVISASIMICRARHADEAGRKTETSAPKVASSTATATPPTPSTPSLLALLKEQATEIATLKAELSAMKVARNAGTNPTPSGNPAPAPAMPRLMVAPTPPARPTARPITAADLYANRVETANRLIRRAEDIRGKARLAETIYGKGGYTTLRTWELAHTAEAAANAALADADACRPK